MKLLQKTIRRYLWYSVFILAIAIPAFYFTIQNIMRHEIDEELLATKTNLRPKLEKIFFKKEFVPVNFLDDHLSIRPSASTRVYDTLYSINMFDSSEKEMIPFRVIESNLLIHGDPYLLKKSTSLMENEDLIKSILIVQVILLLLLLTGLFIINRKLSLSIWKPFYKSLDKLRNYSVEKDSSLSLPATGIAEFDDLNESLEMLASRTHQTYLSQKEFTENASHEMQTPIAVFQSKLELLMQTTPLNAEQAGLIDELADAGQRMQRLNKSLVLLTRIENNQFPEVEHIAIREVLTHYLQLYAAQLQEKQLSVTLTGNSNQHVSANKMLLEILAGNLLGNAIRHNYSGGNIAIEMLTEGFTISNTGKSEALEEKLLFRRFQKESTDSNSIGLGLEISKKITQLYGFKLSYRFEDTLHKFQIDYH